ncbi:MAG: hypothetical protein HYZ21_00895 [Chloroflexi bacterium]|nr:hypothetical protein [Chloroflexota bacterium]
MAKKSYSFNTISLVKILFLVIFVSACFLSIRAIYDITNFNIFPTWFVPVFGLVVLALIALCLYFGFQVWKLEGDAHLLSGKQSILLWIFMPLSFVCTTAVHSFFPFRSDVSSILPWVDPVMKINYAVAIFGFATSIALAGVYSFTRLKNPAVIGLAIMALLTLIPNDNCSNPFNYWWIEKIGASPLMYTPNLYAVLFVTSGLYGIHPKGTAFLTICICLGSLLLGVGHQIGFLW